MTLGNKILMYFLGGTAALGGSYGAGYYRPWKEKGALTQQLAAEGKKAGEVRESISKELWRSRARGQLLEAAFAAQVGHHAMALERLIAVMNLAGNLKINVQAELDELQGLLVAQKPEAIAKLLTLADRFEPIRGLSLPTPAPTPATTKPPVPVGMAPPAPAQPVAAGAQARPAAAVPGDLEPIRELLRQAKELALIGGDTTELARKLARAQVLLNEAGTTSVDEEIAAAIKACRTHDEGRLRSTIDTVFAKLRNP